jgi:ABC-type transporter Mla subunit MlaD
VTRLALLFVALVAVVAAVILSAAGGTTGSTVRVDAIFDNAANLIPGQDVKIAGAKVGSVTNIELTSKRQARVEMEIDSGFAPFRSDADCIVRPQSIIGEKFVQCDPGTPGGKELAKDGPAPTVPVTQTHSPVDLDLVFSTLRLPYRQRLTVIVNELGAGLAGRPRELAATIHRANPALQQTDRVLKILDRDRAVLGRLVERSDHVVGELSARNGDVAAFIERADAVARATASRKDELQQTIANLPPLLDQLEPSAARLADFSRDATPVVRQVRFAAPGVRSVFADLGPLNDAARPALVKLSAASKTGRSAVAAARPVATRLKSVARRLPPIVRTSTQLLESIRDRGAVEGLQLFSYYGATSTARFDQYSHILPSYQLAGSCQQYVSTPTAGCSSRFAGAASQAAALADAKKRGRGAPRDITRGKPGTGGGGAPGGPAAPEAPQGGQQRPKLGPLELPKLPDLPLKLPGDKSPNNVLDFLLGK